MSVGFLWFFCTHLGWTSDFELWLGLTLILGPDWGVNGLLEQVLFMVTGRSRRRQDNIQTHLKFLVWQHGLCLPVFQWSKQIIWLHPKSMGQWNIFYNNEVIAWAGNEGRIENKMSSTTTSKKAFLFLLNAYINCTLLNT